MHTYMYMHTPIPHDVIHRIQHHTPSNAGLSHHTVQLGLLRVLLADVADVGLSVVGHKPRLVDRDRPTRLTLV